MTHMMNLQHEPFVKIKNGTKTIEMRLYDEKRSRIKVGDFIVFTDIDSGETIECSVTKLFIYSTFEELYFHHDQRLLGYRCDEEAKPSDMLRYYSADEIKRFGVVGIELERRQSYSMQR